MMPWEKLRVIPRIIIDKFGNRRILQVHYQHVKYIMPEKPWCGAKAVYDKTIVSRYLDDVTCRRCWDLANGETQLRLKRPRHATA